MPTTDTDPQHPDATPPTPSSTPHRAASLRHLSPGYFACVMATGIVSIGLREIGLPVASTVLLGLATFAYVALWVLYGVRAVKYPDATLRDLRDPQTAFAYFTVVAGTGVVGVGFASVNLIAVASVLIAVTAGLWFIFGYLLPWQVLMQRDGQPILARADGTWFVWAVASQSLAVGLAHVQPYANVGGRWLSLLTVLSWSVGMALYAAVALLVLLRIIVHGITPAQFTPPYWVAMGALAIAVVAGANIVEMPADPVIDAARSLIAGTVVIVWTLCAWLIPLLLAAGVWRHVVRRIRWEYEPGLWSMVFPMGMFGVASLSVARADDIPSLEAIGGVVVVIAAAVWLIVGAAMVRRVTVDAWRAHRQRPRRV
ncbi:tellurite resistance/C4-dicarboxylate transporter family protein [Microbacterium sp. YY-01]|uniref:tellurite resistance/C4-dicarboxylate transporter family protein n=1 Tax=Microbacterium sp. YY-01 TaxID=3421634 RepID=UPI003D1839B4